MVAKSIGEAIERVMCMAKGSEFKEILRGEIRDFLAHSVARYCKKHHSMIYYDVLTHFVQELVVELPQQLLPAPVINPVYEKLNDSLKILEGIIADKKKKEES